MTPWRIISQPKPRHVHKFSGGFIEVHTLLYAGS